MKLCILGVMILCDLIWCECHRCKNSDSSPIGVICMLCEPQFTESGKCLDFELKCESEENL